MTIKHHRPLEELSFRSNTARLLDMLAVCDKHLNIILSVPFLLFSLITTVKKLDRERSDSGLLRHKQDLDHTLTVTQGSYWERSRKECKSQRLGRTV